MTTGVAAAATKRDEEVEAEKEIDERSAKAYNGCDPNELHPHREPHSDAVTKINEGRIAKI